MRLKLYFLLILFCGCALAQSNFQPGAQLNVFSLSSDPSPCNAGQIWYNTTSNTYKICPGGSAATIGTGSGSGTVTSFSAGTLSPLFTTSVATPTSTPALSFTLSNAAANTVFANLTGSSAAPSFTATQGTDTKVLTSGTISGTTAPLCTDANGGATTTSCPAGTVTSFSAGNLSPLFTSSVGTATSTPALTFSLSNAAANTIFGNLTGSPAGPSFVATQGTDTKVLTSGTVSGTAASLCTDANGGATTSGCPATGVSSFTGDTTVLSNSGSTGAVTATLANAAPGKFLGNAGTSSAAPAYVTLSAVNAQTATYQVVAGDFSAYKTIAVASGTFTVTLVASGSQPPAGQYITIINYGAGVVTVAVSGQNMNGATTSLVLKAATSITPTGAYIISDGTNYQMLEFGVNAATLNTATWAGPQAIGSTTPNTGAFTTLTGTTINTTTNCAAVGTAASPSVVSCSSAAAGAFSCATNASGATCTVNTTAVTASSEIFVTLVSDEGTRLSVTCNTAPTALPTVLVATKTAGTGFTINLPTYSTNPACFNYHVVN